MNTKTTAGTGTEELRSKTIEPKNAAPATKPEAKTVTLGDSFKDQKPEIVIPPKKTIQNLREMGNKILALDEKLTTLKSTRTSILEMQNKRADGEGTISFNVGGHRLSTSNPALVGIVLKEFNDYLTLQIPRVEAELLSI